MYISFRKVTTGDFIRNGLSMEVNIYGRSGSLEPIRLNHFSKIRTTSSIMRKKGRAIATNNNRKRERERGKRHSSFYQKMEGSAVIKSLLIQRTEW